MAQVKKEMKKCLRTTYLGYEVGVSHLIFENVVTEIHLSGRINEFIENIFLSKKQIIEKKFVSKKICVKFFLSKKKIILSLFFYKYLQVYYVYLQSLGKVLVIFYSSHVLAYRKIPWSLWLL